MIEHADEAEAWPAEDEIMQEVRAVREAYAARFGCDVRALMAHLREQAEQSGRAVVKRKPRRIEMPEAG